MAGWTAACVVLSVNSGKDCACRVIACWHAPVECFDMGSGSSCCSARRQNPFTPNPDTPPISLLSTLLSPSLSLLFRVRIRPRLTSTRPTRCPTSPTSPLTRPPSRTLATAGAT